jgi:hypothetical protein
VASSGSATFMSENAGVAATPAPTTVVSPLTPRAARSPARTPCGSATSPSGRATGSPVTIATLRSSGAATTASDIGSSPSSGNVRRTSAEIRNVAALTSSNAEGESASNRPVASAGPATLAADQIVTSAPIAVSPRGPARAASADFAAGW